MESNDSFQEIFLGGINNSVWDYSDGGWEMKTQESLSSFCFEHLS